MRFSRVSMISLAALLATGCATNTGVTRPDWLYLDAFDTGADSPSDTAANQQQSADTDALAPSVSRTRVPSLREARDQSGSIDPSRPDLSSEPVNATLPPQPLPAFINTVFGEILEQPFTLGPGVSERQELISLRSVNDMTPDAFLALTEQVLEDYGIGVTYEAGLFSVVELAELRAQMPQFIRSRSHANVPASLRPVVQFVELQAIDAAIMQEILRQAFPDNDVLNITTNRLFNSVTLSGLAPDVNAAMSLIQQMDELRFAGTQVVTVNVRNWDAQMLSNSMGQILTLEGFSVGVGVTAPRSLTLLPIEFSNQIMIFAANRSLADHALALAIRLDREAYDEEVDRPHVYQVEHIEATILAEIIAGVIGDPEEEGSARSSSRSSGSSSESGEEGAGVTTVGSNITVDELGNRIVFMGTQNEFDQFQALARQLDTPVPEVLIEVTIAEVTLTDNTSYGLDVIFDSETASRFSANLTSNAGFSGTVRSGQVTLTGNANATNNQVNILSTPRIVARSGSEASVQVGDDVPIVTAQRALDNQNGGSGDFIQNFQYRSTGILLNIAPRVYSNNRIDLEITQETSSAEENSSSNISSPQISTRTLSSQMSLQDGQTAVLGGLIENRFTNNNNGLPFIKDIPILGAPFRDVTLQSSRTMLVVLVTPYVLDSRNDRQEVVDTLTRALNAGFEGQTRQNGTMLPPNTPMEIRPARSVDPTPSASASDMSTQ